VLDETDSGLDIDALGVVSRGIEEVRRERPNLASCSSRTTSGILEHLVPDFVHVLPDGRIVANGRPGARPSVEAEGFDAFRTARPAAGAQWSTERHARRRSA